MRRYPAVEIQSYAAPNADTLYTEARLDVSEEPLIFSVSHMDNRYYIVAFLDGRSEVRCSRGMRWGGADRES